MKVPMFIAKKVLGRSNYSKTRIQTDGYGYEVPFIKQKHANMCGDACLEMLSQYMGWGLNINLGTNPRGAFDGLDGSDVLTTYGTRVCQGYANNAQQLEGLLKRRGPIMCAGTFAHMGVIGVQGHWILIKGADASHFWTHDPWHGANVKLSKAQLYADLDGNPLGDPSLIHAS